MGPSSMPVWVEPLDAHAGDEGITLFGSAAWRGVLRESYGFSFFRVRGGGAATLPFATTGGRLRARAVSLPFADYLCTDTVPPADYRALADAVRAAHPELPIVLKTTYPHDAEGLGAVVRKAYYHRVPTAAGTDVEQGLSGSFRRGVRKAQREGVRIERATDEEAVGAFYDLHRGLRFGKFGSLPQPMRFFEAIRKGFMTAGRGFVLLARHRGRVVAALVALRHRDVLYYKFGASAEDALGVRPNNLLFRELLHHAVAEGYAAVDLGLSGAGPSYAGLRRFKEALGGRAQPVTYFRLDPPGYDAAAEQELGALLSALSRAVVEHHLGPDPTDAFSELLYPYFA